MDTVNWWKRRRTSEFRSLGVPKFRGSRTAELRNLGTPEPPSRLLSQETEHPAQGPDMEPPSDEDLYDVDVDPDIDNPDVADDTGAPPFTGEDVEDVDDRRRRGPHSPTM